MQVKEILEDIEKQIIDERLYYSEQETDFDKGAYKAFTNTLTLVQEYLDELKGVNYERV